MPRTKQFNREEVLDRAVELFWKKGFNGTSMQDLVQHLGINRGSLYDTFGDKQKLFDEAVTRYRCDQRSNMNARLNKYDDVNQGLRAFFELNIRTTVSDPDRKGCFVVNSVAELIPGVDPDLKNKFAENQATFESVMFEYLQKGVERGQISSDKDLTAIASMLYTMSVGLQVVAKVNSDKKQLKAIVDQALAALD